MTINQNYLVVHDHEEVHMQQNRDISIDRVLSDWEYNIILLVSAVVEASK